MCLDDTMVGTFGATVNSCVINLNFAAVSSLSLGDDSIYKGILGLGKYTGAADALNTNFVYEWAMDNYQ